jgi:hypothetical protein
MSNQELFSQEIVHSPANPAGIILYACGQPVDPNKTKEITQVIAKETNQIGITAWLPDGPGLDESVSGRPALFGYEEAAKSMGKMINSVYQMANTSHGVLPVDGVLESLSGHLAFYAASKFYANLTRFNKITYMAPYGKDGIKTFGRGAMGYAGSAIFGVLGTLGKGARALHLTPQVIGPKSEFLRKVPGLNHEDLFKMMYGVTDLSGIRTIAAPGSLSDVFFETVNVTNKLPKEVVLGLNYPLLYTAKNVSQIVADYATQTTKVTPVQLSEYSANPEAVEPGLFAHYYHPHARAAFLAMMTRRKTA